MKHKNLLSILALFLAFGATNIAKAQTINYREEMRQFVIGISDYARAAHPNFIVIPQNGMPLITSDGEPSSPVVTNYANAIDGTGIESLFYGYPKGTRKTPIAVQQPMLALADVFKANGKTVMVTDYCNGKKALDASYTNNNAHGYISIATKVSLTRIPKYPAQPYNVNNNDITAMSDAKNFLYLIDPDKFKTKTDFLAAINATDYDMLVIDLFFINDGTALTADDLAQLKIKHNGGRRLVISYMSIGEAESYRYYWNKDWLKKDTRPVWLKTLNKRWAGNYAVEYWNPEWQAIIYGSENAYLDKVLQAGFDGVYLDIIDGYEYFEAQQTP